MSGDPLPSMFRPRISYTYTPTPPRGRFSRIELEHLAIAYTVLTAALFLVWNGGLGGLALTFDPSDRIFYELAVLASAGAALTGFVAHEMAHKFAAQERGLWAEFRMSPQGLAFSLIFAALIGFLFATPGATMIGGSRGDRREWGITSLAGPAMNLSEASAIAAGMAIYLHVHPLFWYSIWIYVPSYLIFINIVFAVFNLIPWGPLDGLKVYRWSKGVWLGALLLGLGAGVMSYLYLPFI